MTHKSNTPFAVGDKVRATRHEPGYGHIFDSGVVEDVGRLAGGNRVLFIRFPNGQIRRFHSDYITKFVSHDTGLESETSDVTITREQQKLMRNDPARKAAVAQIIASRQEVFVSALAKLNSATEELLALGDLDGNVLMERTRLKILIARDYAQKDARIFMAKPNDANLGNIACKGFPKNWTPT